MADSSYPGIRPNGKVKFLLKESGEWDINGQFGQQTDSQKIFVSQPESTFTVNLNFDEAVLYVTSPIGTLLTISNGTETLSAVSTGSNSFTLYTFGSWTISGQLEGYTLNSSTFSAQPGGVYQEEISILYASLIVNAPNGTQVTATYNGATVSGTVSSGSVVLTIYQIGTWNVSGIVGDLVTSQENVNINEFSEFEVTLTLSTATIVVTAPNGTLVTAQNGDLTLTQSATTGSTTFTVQKFGTWTISGALSGYTFDTQSISVQNYQQYEVTLTPLSSNITVVSPAGTTITVTNGSTTLTQTSNGSNTFTVNAGGQWSVSGTLQGYVLSSEDVDVVLGQSYSVELTILSATITVNAPDGTLVTMSGPGDDQSKTATSGTAVFTVYSLGTYSFSGTLNGLSTNTTSVNVNSFSDFITTLTISYATITVFAPENTEVTIENSGTQFSETVVSESVVFSVQLTGNWTVSGVLSGYLFANQTVNVTNLQGNYSATLTPLLATITVTAPAGTEVVAENSTGEQVQGYVSNGTAVLDIYSLDTWTVSGTQNGLVTNSVPVQVTDWTNYPVTLTIWAATITVTTPTGTLVTAQNGGTQIQATASANQVIFAVQVTGNWTVSAQFDTQSDSEIVNVQAEQDYPVRLWVPTIVPTVVTGSVVTCTQGDTVLTKTSQSGQVRFYVPTLGEWTLNATLNQQSSNTVIIDVQEDRDYPLLLNYTFATITVATVAGTEVTAQNGSISTIQYANDDGEAVFEIATFGTWTLSASFDGELVTAAVQVSEAINYDVSISPPEYEVQYVGAIDPLSVARSNLAATSVGDYALFGGGRNDSYNNLSTVDSYSESLVHNTAMELSVARSYLAAASVGNYALFGGGRNTSVVDAYDNSLTRFSANALSTAVQRLSGVSFGEYAIFGGGSNSKYVNSYNGTLTRSVLTQLSFNADYVSGASNGEYALFGMGLNSGGSVNAYNTSLTKTIPSRLSVDVYMGGAAKASEYALFGGGVDSGQYNEIVNSYDKDLVRTIQESLSSARSSLSAESLGIFGIFAGGEQQPLTSPEPYSGAVDVYNKSLVRSSSSPLNIARQDAESASVGNYFLVGGGNNETVQNEVDVYTARVKE